MRMQAIIYSVDGSFKNVFWYNMIISILLVIPIVLGMRISVPGLDKHECYLKPGDINIGIFYYIHKHGSTEDLCSDDYYLYPEKRMKDLELYGFAVEQLNKRTDILPNITVGFVALDDCAWDIGALSKAVYFAPLEANDGTRMDAISNMVTNCSEGMQHFPVVGVTGITNSRKAVMVSSFLSVFHIPVLGFYATSDELSDKSRYEYFMRLSPPDRFQVEAMLDFIQVFNWTYISLFYSEGSFGESGARGIEKGAKKKGMCIAVSQMVDFDATESDFDHFVTLLLKNTKARVVVLFLSYDNAKELILAIERRHAVGKFIWIGPDSLSLTELIPAANGTFAIHHMSNSISTDEYADYLFSLTPSTHSENPWMYGLWEEFFDCKWNSQNNNRSCYRYANTPKDISEKPDIASRLSIVLDVFSTFGYGLDMLIKDNCPLAYQDISLLASCIKGNLLLAYLKNVTFDGHTGLVKFDQNGDMLGHYMIKQHRYTPKREEKEVALWDKARGKITVHHENIDWSFFNFENENQNEELIIESVCSKPCKIKEYSVRLELPCCWDCRNCRENEIIVNASHCELCEMGTWPDKVSATVCEDIIPDYLEWSEGISLGLLVLTIFGILSWLATLSMYSLNWHAKLIKASSRELSSIILVGILLAYLGVFAHLLRPIAVSCHLRIHSFNLSVALIYAPLLMKTNRVYRIFNAGKKGQKAGMTGSRIQLIFTGLLFLLQVCFSISY